MDTDPATTDHEAPGPDPAPAGRGPAAMDPVWHISLDGEPQAPGEQGFVHASFPGQLAETLSLHYPDARRVMLLRLDPAVLGSRLVLEPSRGGQLFPHVYGEVPAAAVLEKVELARADDGRLDLSAISGTDGR